MRAERDIRVVKPEQMIEIEPHLKAEFDSRMVMIRLYVSEASDRATAQYLLRGMRRECKILAERFGLRGE